MRHRLLVLTLLALAAGCSQRERANPLDPENPQTGGRPEQFNAVAGYAVVRLTWKPQPTFTIDGFRLERLIAGDSVFRTLSPLLPPTSDHFLDSGLHNGDLVRYRLYYVAQGNTHNLPAEDVATPGPGRPWVADRGANALVRLSPDGRDVAFRVSGAGSIQSLAVSPATGNVWSSSRLDGTLTLRDAGGLLIAQQTGLASPYTLAHSPADESVWVCELGGSLTHFDESGQAIAPRIGLLDNPSGVAVSGNDGSIWACETGANRVRHFGPTGTPLGAISAASPSRVAVDSANGVAWVTSYATGKVWRVSPTTTLIDSTLAADGPYGLAIDTFRNRVWIADAFAGRVLILDRSTMAVLRVVGPLPDAEDIAIDRATGEAWVVVRGEARVVRLSPLGDLLERCDGFVDPFEIRLDPGNP